MKDLKKIIKEFKEKTNCKDSGYKADDNSYFEIYESISTFNFQDKYYNVCFTKTLKGISKIEIRHTTDCVDYVLGIIKEIEPDAVVVSYKKTVTYTEVIN
tara:strand:- start:2661 stop:2960 length:300 start_codon:yes stop_codon:yes gene_type:complete